MIKSENKDTGNPLSVIPKYTINTLLDWQVTSKFSANVNWTLYGRRNRGNMRKFVLKTAYWPPMKWAPIPWLVSAATIS